MGASIGPWRGHLSMSQAKEVAVSVDAHVKLLPSSMQTELETPGTKCLNICLDIQDDVFFLKILKQFFRQAEVDILRLNLEKRAIMFGLVICEDTHFRQLI